MSAQHYSECHVISENKQSFFLHLYVVLNLGFFLEPDPELICLFRDRLKCNRLSTMMVGFDTGISVLKYLLMVCIPCTVFVNLFAFLLILHLILNSRALLLSNKYIAPYF